MLETLWILVADGRRARLLEAGRTPLGRLHVEERAGLESRWWEHASGGEAGPPAPDRLGRELEGHLAEERLQRFAREVSGWLEKEMAQRGFTEACAFAAPRFLGALRKAWPAALQARIQDNAEELANLNSSELAQHPAVMRAVEARIPASQRG